MSPVARVFQSVWCAYRLSALGELADTVHLHCVGRQQRDIRSVRREGSALLAVTV